MAGAMVGSGSFVIDASKAHADDGIKEDINVIISKDPRQGTEIQEPTRKQLILSVLKTKAGQEKLAHDWSNSAFPPSEELAERLRLTKDWYKYIPPESVTIPTIGIEAQLILADEIKTDKENVNTLETPDYGIATPSRVIANNVVIFGHSRWEKEMQPMADIQNLKLNEKIVIRAGELSKVFVTTQYKLYDYSDPDFLLSGMDRQFLTLQTTASIGGDPILDPAIVLGKLTSKPNITSDHTALLVLAEPLNP